MNSELAENKQNNIESEELHKLIKDARRFILSQKGAIEIAPLQAHASALVFSPCGSLVKSLFKREEPDWIELKPKVEMNWDPCLQTLEGHNSEVISVIFSNDGQRLALFHAGKCLEDDHDPRLLRTNCFQSFTRNIADHTDGAANVYPVAQLDRRLEESGHGGAIADLHVTRLGAVIFVNVLCD